MIAAGYDVEIRERYTDIVSNRWPISVTPLPDELLSSWIHRLAFANGIASRPFAGILGLGNRMWSPFLDLQLPHRIAALLCDQSGIPYTAISALSVTDWALTPLMLPLRENTHRSRSAWIQYCPLCLADDKTPYFRRQWRLASRISCFVHGSGLRDRCPTCHRAIAPFDHRELLPQHFCARCGFDLRTAAKPSVKLMARRLERVIADICRVEQAKGSGAIVNFIARVLRIPATLDISPSRTLKSLSTPARIRCLERLAEQRFDWLMADRSPAIAYQHWMILAADSHEALITQLADYLERRQTPRLA